MGMTTKIISNQIKLALIDIKTAQDRLAKLAQEMKSHGLPAEDIEHSARELEARALALNDILNLMEMV